MEDPIPPHFSGTSVPQAQLAQAAQQLGGAPLLVPCPRRGGRDLPLGVGSAQVKQFALELGECEVHGPLACRYTLTGQYMIRTER